MNKVHVLSTLVALAVLSCGGEEFTSAWIAEDAATEVKPKQDAKPEAEAAPSEGGDQVSPEAQPEAAVEPQPEAGQEAEPESGPEAETESQPETGPEAQSEIQPETGPEAEPEPQPEAGPEAEADVELSDSPEEPVQDAKGEDIVEAGPMLTDCEKFGVPGMPTLIIRHGLSQTSLEAGLKVLAVHGKLTFNDASKNTSYATWCWALPGEKQQLVCVPKDNLNLPVNFEDGMAVEFGPGETSYGVPIGDGDLFCDSQDCPTGDFQLCKGKEKEPICRVKDGVWTTAQKFSGPWGIAHIRCTLPNTTDQ